MLDKRLEIIISDLISDISDWAIQKEGVQSAFHSQQFPSKSFLSIQHYKWNRSR